MEDLILLAYNIAPRKDLFTVTTELEKLLRRRKGKWAEPLYHTTTGMVRRLLATHGMPCEI